MNPLKTLQHQIIRCQKCPRLVHYIGQIRKKYPNYWCRPVQSFGDRHATILLLGLAPGRFGSNRTGRMFTGDASGRFMYPILYKLGLANQPNAENAEDGLKLIHTYLTAAVRCAPPKNKPTLQEINRCVEYVRQEIDLLPHLRVVVALGKIAHDAYLHLIGGKKSLYPFQHGAVHQFKNKPALVDIYHPSRQNTQTGRLTEKMFLEVLSQAKELAATEHTPVAC
jgi:uracil-DNA glycosylase family 4